MHEKQKHVLQSHAVPPVAAAVQHPAERPPASDSGERKVPPIRISTKARGIILGDKVGPAVLLPSKQVRNALICSNFSSGESG
jgi:hypothetical protein